MSLTVRLGNPVPLAFSGSFGLLALVSVRRAIAAAVIFTQQLPFKSPEFVAHLTGRVSAAAADFALANPQTGRVVRNIILTSKYPLYQVATRTSLGIKVAISVLITYCATRVAQAAWHESETGQGAVRYSCEALKKDGETVGGVGQKLLAVSNIWAKVLGFRE